MSIINIKTNPTELINLLHYKPIIIVSLSLTLASFLLLKTSLIEDHIIRNGVFIFALISTVIFIASVIFNIYSCININSVLSNLLPIEKYALSLFVDNGTSSIEARIDNGVVTGLCKKGILFRPSKQAGSVINFNINPIYYEILRKKPSLLDGGRCQDLLQRYMEYDRVKW